MHMQTSVMDTFQTENCPDINFRSVWYNLNIFKQCKYKLKNKNEMEYI